MRFKGQFGTVSLSLILTKSHGWEWSHRAERHQHSICVECQALEGPDVHASCGNQGVPRRDTAFRCRRSLRMTATRPTADVRPWPPPYNREVQDRARHVARPMPAQSTAIQQHWEDGRNTLQARSEHDVMFGGMKHHACLTLPTATAAGKSACAGLVRAPGSCWLRGEGTGRPSYSGKRAPFRTKHMPVFPGGWTSARSGVPDARSMCALA